MLWVFAIETESWLLSSAVSKWFILIDALFFFGRGCSEGCVSLISTPMVSNPLHLNTIQMWFIILYFTLSCTHLAINTNWLLWHFRTAGYNFIWSFFIKIGGVSFSCCNNGQLRITTNCVNLAVRTNCSFPLFSQRNEIQHLALQ